MAILPIVHVQVYWPCWLVGHTWRNYRYALHHAASGGAMQGPPVWVFPADAYEQKPEGFNLVKIEKCVRCAALQSFNVGPGGSLTKG